MLLHQGIGLEAFNELPTKKAVHALYECCNSVVLARDLARERPYPDRNALFRKADALLFSLSEQSVDDILQAYPMSAAGRTARGRRPSTARCGTSAPR